MIVQCPQCSTRFRLDPRRLSERGARVTCSVCQHGFVVRPADDVEALDPFATTNVDAPRAPVAFDAETTASSSIPAFDFDSAPHDAKTAVHIVPPGFRDNERSPRSFDDLSTDVDAPATRTSMSLDEVSAAVRHDDFLAIDINHDDEPTSIGDDDVMSIDEDEVVSIDDEPTIDLAAHTQLQQPAAPQYMPETNSRASTVVTHTPSLLLEQSRGGSASGQSTFQQQAHEQTTSVMFVPSLSRPDNDALRESAMLSAGGGMETFVGRIDPALMARSIPQQDDADLMMNGGLSSDGTYSPPQETTRPAIAFEGPTDVHGLQLDRPERRQTRPMQSGLSEGMTQDGVSRQATAPETNRGMRIARGAMTVMLSLTLIGLALFALVRSGQLDMEVLLDPERIVNGNEVEGATGILGVQPLSMRSVLYPTVHGRILVFTGEAQNTSTQPVSNLEVVAEVFGKDEKVIASAREQLGVVLSVAELSRLETPEAVSRAFAQKSTGPVTLAPGEHVQFMVVISPAPRELRSSRHRVRLAQVAAPPAVTAPQPAPVVPEVVNEPPAQIETAPVGATDDDAAQRKAKLKAKRMKMKRKARGADGDEQPTPSEPAE